MPREVADCLAKHTGNRPISMKCTGVCMAFPDIGYVCEFLAIYTCACACACVTEGRELNLGLMSIFFGEIYLVIRLNVN